MDPIRITGEDSPVTPKKGLPENFTLSFKPNEDRVIVFVLPQDQMSKAGLWIPEDKQKPLSLAQVVGVGEDVNKSIVIGSKVMFPTPAGYEFTYDEVDLKVIRATNIEAWE
jgi:co-chaperonin GroES (HSP10)